MAEIYVFRHGQTDYNKERVFTGWDDPDINENGIKECEEIAAQLSGKRPTKAYSSDQIRARHSLQIVLGGAEVPITIDQRLKERNYGELTGKKKQEIMEAYPSEYVFWHRSYDIQPPGGESIKEVETRVLSFIKDFEKGLRKNDVVFMSVHGNSLRPIRRHFENMSIEDMCTFEHTKAKVYCYNYDA